MTRRVCNGCGGYVGVDCFNPEECEWIARDQEVQARLAAEDRRREAQHYERMMREDHEREMDRLQGEEQLEAWCGS
jgi:hypothetical protein